MPLPPFGPTVVADQVLAHDDVSFGEPLSSKGRLTRALEADEDDDLGPDCLCFRYKIPVGGAWSASRFHDWPPERKKGHRGFPGRPLRGLSYFSLSLSTPPGRGIGTPAEVLVSVVKSAVLVKVAGNCARSRLRA